MSEGSKRYRPNVAAVIVDRRNRVLLGERIKHPGTWQIPQGGIGPGETEEDALRREIYEETGIRSLRVISRSGHHFTYDFPPDLLKRGHHGFDGQRQRYFLVRFLGRESEIHLEVTDHPEFRSFRWVYYDQVRRLAVRAKQKAYSLAFEEFRPILFGARPGTPVRKAELPKDMIMVSEMEELIPVDHPHGPDSESDPESLA